MKIIFFVFAFVPLCVVTEEWSHDYTRMLETDLPRFCFNAAILLEEGDTKCNGIIISSTQILTSDKCLMYQKYYGYMDLSKNISVRVGSTERLSGGMNKILNDTNRVPQTMRDLAVLILKEPLPFGPTICPIRLAEKKDDIYIKEGVIVETSGFDTALFNNITDSRIVSTKIMHINQCLSFLLNGTLPMEGGKNFISFI